MDTKLVKEIAQETGLTIRTVRSALGLRQHPTGAPRLSTVRTVRAALVRITSQQEKEAGHASK